MIIFSIFALLFNIGCLALGENLVKILEAAGAEAPTVLDYIISLLTAAVEMAAGIMGIRYRDRKLTMNIGIVYLALTVISIIMSAVKTGFAFSSLTSLIIPVLYWWGAYQSE